MGQKIKALLHMPAIFAIAVLAPSFSGTAFQIVKPGIYAETLYICLYIVSVFAIIFLYAAYVLKKPLPILAVRKPACITGWCAAAILLAVSADAFCIIFTEGKFQAGNLGQEGLAYMLFVDIFSRGVCSSVTQAALFFGLASCCLEEGWGKKGTIFFSASLYAVTQPVWFGSPCPGGFLWQFLASFTVGIAMALVSGLTGSAWTPAAIRAFYTVFSGESHILHIGTQQLYPALFMYTFSDTGKVGAGMEKTYCLYFVLPEAAVFCVIGIAAWLMGMGKDGTGMV